MAIQYSDALDRTFRALGDGTRRGMLAMLAKRGECTAGELGAPFSVSQPTVSKHIRALERARLVKRRVEGRVHRFRLVDGRLGRAQDWIERQRTFWAGALDQLERSLREFERP